MKTGYKKLLYLIPSVLFLIILLQPSPMNLDWKTASRQSARIAPLPELSPEAQVQIYSAKAFSWRGKFSVHTWIATKEKNAQSYVVYHVLMWAARSGNGVVSITEDIPDRYWYGAKPSMIFSVSGSQAEKMIPKIYDAAKSYPYPNFYRAYPGPNSNTFVSHIMRLVSGFNVELPSNAIGKDWIFDAKFFGPSETRSGIQFSLWGMFGFTIGLKEGIEVNIIGLSFGIDFLRPAIKLPFIGRIGMKDK